MKRIRSLLLNLAVLILSLMAFLLLMEGVLRAFSLKAPTYVTPAMFEESNLLYKPNSQGHWYGPLGNIVDYAPLITTNDLGYHDTTHTLKKAPGTFRIVIMGDSFVEAFQVVLEKTFFKILEQRLNQEPKKIFGDRSVEILAFAHSGYGAGSEYELLESTAIRYEPDLVLTVLFEENDFKDDLFYHYRKQDKSNKVNEAIRNIQASLKLSKEQDLYNQYLLVKGSEINRWIAFFMLERVRKRRLDQTNKEYYQTDLCLYEKPGADVFDRAMYGAYKNGFNWTLVEHRKMKKLSEAHGARYAVVLINNTFYGNPKKERELYRLFPLYKGKLDFEKPRRDLQNFFKNEMIPYLDLNPIFGKNASRYNWPHDGHWNELGHKRAAEAVYTFLESLYSK